ncbi:MAG: MBOAT family O-acyltransferase [Bacteroidota bacterium]
MLFNSLQFILFFVIVTTLYFSIRHKYSWILLLISSCYFYMAFVPVYILILLFTSVVDYFAGIAIEKSNGGRKKFYLAITLVANIGVLGFFKYYNFLNENISFLLGGFGIQDRMPFLSYILPIGLSFHTFQAMSYAIEIYRGNFKAERKFGMYFLYEMFYPRLVAGPIERPQNLLHQFYEPHKFDMVRVSSGLQLMAWGLFKKLVIADRLAIIVNNVYEFPTNFEGISLAIATVFFAFQVYCDFSGYTDIAIGAAEVMGFKLMTNFNRPYLSKSIAEFWQRWHISLSTWFRDYLYLPLAYSTSRKLKKESFLGIKTDYAVYIYATMITFLICGLWHGSSWNFVIWGGLHGIFLIVALLTSRPKARIYKKLGINKQGSAFRISQILVTFSLVSLAWVFFRANTLQDALYICTHMFTGIAANIREVLHNHAAIKTIITLDSGRNFAFSMILLPLFLWIESLKRKGDVRDLVRQQPLFKRYIIYYIFIMVFILFGVFDSSRQFIYFQF